MPPGCRRDPAERLTRRDAAERLTRSASRERGGVQRDVLAGEVAVGELTARAGRGGTPWPARSPWASGRIVRAGGDPPPTGTSRSHGAAAATRLSAAKAWITSA